ncbi:hypothetical protein [Amycolatopsis sp. DG1A-15b]|uniref:hypothetical protein n=1 Tax=Amycolatopsis sp. DG1A-15b TaxID=3052846 RepID=UPI00255C002B|nr:hypothetical protein [Amycolatopsis sp. DG1A-15b]WIX88699.1 hypothetical protein QRY02_47610 [Amycolatopsis sp. DG1A-15b]
MSPANLRLPDPSPARPAKPPTPTMVVFVSELRRVVLQGQPVERQAPAMVAFVPARGQVACQGQAVEPLASARVALVVGRGSVPMSAVREWVAA